MPSIVILLLDVLLRPRPGDEATPFSNWISLRAPRKETRRAGPRSAIRGGHIDSRSRDTPRGPSILGQPSSMPRVGCINKIGAKIGEVVCFVAATRSPWRCSPWWAGGTAHDGTAHGVAGRRLGREADVVVRELRSGPLFGSRYRNEGF